MPRTGQDRAEAAERPWAVTATPAPSRAVRRTVRLGVPTGTGALPVLARPR